MAAESAMESVEVFRPGKRVREKNFYFHSVHKKSYTDWCHVKTADRIVFDSPVAVSVVERAEAIEGNVESTFHSLAEDWSASVGNVSSLTAMAKHPKYRAIINLGWDVVPFLLIDLQKNHRFWFPALTEITTIQPYDPHDAGNFKRMTDAWIMWGKKKQLI